MLPCGLYKAMDMAWLPERANTGPDANEQVHTLILDFPDAVMSIALNPRVGVSCSGCQFACCHMLMIWQWQFEELRVDV